VNGEKEKKNRRLMYPLCAFAVSLFFQKSYDFGEFLVTKKVNALALGGYMRYIAPPPCLR
jgi:hypothetical protein